MLSHLKILLAFQFTINRYPRADGATNGETKIKICLHPGNQCSATFRISLFTNIYWAVKAQMGNLSGEEYRFALENTSLSTEPNCGTSLCVQVSLLWSDFYLFYFVLSFFVDIIRYLVFHQPKLNKEGIWNLLGWEFRWGCDGLMPIGARRRRPATIFPPTRVFTTLKANTNIKSNTNTTAHASEKY